MGKALQLAGERFGALIAISDVGSTKQGCRLWLCRCDCGGESVVRGPDLKNGTTKSCGRCPNIFCSNDRFSFLLLEYKGKAGLCFIDPQDYDLIKGYHWYARPSSTGHTFYATATIHKPDGPTTSIQMHRILVPGVEDIDHKDLNGLNNRRENLRPATRSQNMANKRKRWEKATSEFKGVQWRKALHKFRARICVNGKRIDLGHFESEEDAARAYDKAAVEHFGEFACLNFPDQKMKLTV